ncbi:MULTISPECIES: hypothetical protein [Mycolicibacterium]|nr:MULTISPECIES: hypothetical protein [Mycolicibacterium]
MDGRNHTSLGHWRQHIAAVIVVTLFVMLLGAALTLAVAQGAGML